MTPLFSAVVGTSHYDAQNQCIVHQQCDFQIHPNGSTRSKWQAARGFPVELDYEPEPVILPVRAAAADLDRDAPPSLRDGSSSPSEFCAWLICLCRCMELQLGGDLFPFSIGTTFEDGDGTYYRVEEEPNNNALCVVRRGFHLRDLCDAAQVHYWQEVCLVSSEVETIAISEIRNLTLWVPPCVRAMLPDAATPKVMSFAWSPEDKKVNRLTDQ